MKRKEVQTLHDSSLTELNKKRKELEKSLVELMRDRYTKQNKNVHVRRALKKEIAQIQTIITMKELLA